MAATGIPLQGVRGGLVLTRAALVHVVRAGLSYGEIGRTHVQVSRICVQGWQNRYCKTSAIKYNYLRSVKSDWHEVLSELFDGATALRSKDLERRGLPRTRISEAVDAGELERIGRGLYTFQGAEQSEYHSLVQVTRLVPHAAICLLSALRFHDLTSQNPHEVWIAIDPKDRKPSLEYPSVKVVRYGAERFGIGLEEHEVEGTTLRVYSVARTVVDLFRYRNKVGLDVALESLREGWREGKFTLAEINRIAGLCRMRNVMKPYLESLTT